MPTNCPFCQVLDDQIRHQNAAGSSFRDAYPISDGHTLVVPRKHVASLFDLPAEEYAALWGLVAEVRSRLQTEFQPAGFNIGVNDGLAAGQTVAHAHIHVIPRYNGDVADPRGGIRWIIPEKARYW
jgi:diadenosine tetraphosphate (Ap4A) HIT family hydrolase